MNEQLSLPFDAREHLGGLVLSAGIGGLNSFEEYGILSSEQVSVMILPNGNLYSGYLVQNTTILRDGFGLSVSGTNARIDPKDINVAFLNSETAILSFAGYKLQPFLSIVGAVTLADDAKLLGVTCMTSKGLKVYKNDKLSF